VRGRDQDLRSGMISRSLSYIVPGAERSQPLFPGASALSEPLPLWVTLRRGRPTQPEPPGLFEISYLIGERVSSPPKRSKEP